MELTWKQFTCLGTEITITAYLKPQEKYLLDKAQALLAEFEQRFSRFIETSEICELNNFQGGEFQASGMLLHLLERCQYYYRETHGLFNPAIIDVLESVGYDRSFDAINANQITHDSAKIKRLAGQTTFLARPEFNDLKIVGETLFVPPGMRFDLGGIGKGYAADLLKQEVFAKIENYWISAGGDLLVKGNDGEKTGWQISVQNPAVPDKDSFSFNTLGQTIGIATSGVIKRHGIVGGIEWHHLIDPRSSAPADNDLTAVTIIAPTAEQADVYAKTALLLGEVEGLKFIEDRSELAGAIYLKNKSPLFSSRLIKYL
jgi:thiamine biosynthesis lipoprotein